MVAENTYHITLSVAGFSQRDLNIELDSQRLKISGKKQRQAASQSKAQHQKSRFIHQGIAMRNFERTFHLDEHIKVVGADLHDGLLTISLAKEIPEALKPQEIPIGH